MKWRDLQPDDGMLTALAKVGPRPSDDDTQTLKKNWSKSFADACAVMLANALRERRAFKKFHVFPTPSGERAEFVTAAGTRGKGKRVDVAVSSLVAGLQVALTLKGGNFLDATGSGFGKNITGRLYELLDETKAVHEYHPHSLVICVYFFPLAATEDMATKSTFAKAVAYLRGHTGRDDVLQVTQFGRFDESYIGLYVADDTDPRFAPGLCRFFDVTTSPPMLGRPRVDTTLSLEQLAQRIAKLFKGGRAQQIAYAPPEDD